MWWDLDLGGNASVATRLDHVGVERSLYEVLDVAELASLFLEHANEIFADSPALLLGLGDAGQPLEEALIRVDVNERHFEVLIEGAHDVGCFLGPQEPVVDEDAGELVADSTVNEQRRDRRIDTA